eukprot:jgi/Chlat1/2765/Chrsp187S02904
MAASAMTATSTTTPTTTTKHKHTAKRKPLVRLLMLLLAHADIICGLLYVAGVVGVGCYPRMARAMHVSENAFMPGAKYNQLQACLQRSIKLGSATPQWLQQHLEYAGIDAYTQTFPSALSAAVSDGEQPTGINVVGILRATKADGSEGIVLATPVNWLNPSSVDALAVAFGSVLMQHLATMPWLAKDIVWLACDASTGAHAGIEAWVNQYYSPTHAHTQSASNNTSQQYFQRAGAIQTAIVLDFATASFDTVEIAVQGLNGRLPNLDLVTVAQQESSHMQLPFQLAVMKKHEALQSLSVPKFLRQVDEYIPGAQSYWGSVQPLLNFLQEQLVGVPTGVHAAFLEYAIDAITLRLEGRSTQSRNRNVASDRNIHKLGRYMEQLIRDCNNLLERLHHSHSLYLLTDASVTSFVSINDYMLPLGLLLAALPLKAGAIAAAAHTTAGSNFTPSAWLYSLLVVAIAVFGCCIVGASVIISLWQPTSNSFTFPLWSVLLAVVLATTVSFKNPLQLKDYMPPWKAVKCVTLAVTAAGLATVSMLDFALALTCTIALVPAALLAGPTGGVVAKAAVVLLSPIGTALLLGPSFCWDVFRASAQSYVQWWTLAFPVLLTVYLPCSLLSLYLAVLAR